MNDEENYGLEFKAALNNFSKKKVHDYCAAISNEDGGYLVLGVDNRKSIVGTNAFLKNWNTLANSISKDLKIRVKVYQVKTSEGRVLVFEIPRHIISIPVQSVGGTKDYRYPIRDGESLVEMATETLQAIFEERDNDWSSIVQPGASVQELSRDALTEFKGKWAKNTNDPKKLKLSNEVMLNDLQLCIDGKATNAALLLFGTEASVSKFIPDAEIIFEWRNNDQDIAYGERKNWRAGFMLIQDEIWRSINARNVIFRYQEGFIQRDISAFDEETIREAVVNAFVHRDYSIGGRSITIKASPGKFQIENPGRLMPGITLSNIFDRSAWRNRKLAESLEKVNLMERSSQGIDKIFRLTIEAGKGLPELKINSDPAVSLTVPAALEDQQFINFLEQISHRHQTTLSLKEIIELENIRQGKKQKNLSYKDKFLELGIIERIGHGKGSVYILAHRYYKQTNSTGQYTRLSGLSKDVKRSIILEHLNKNPHVTNSDIQEAMTDMNVKDIYRLLNGMRKDKLIEHHGSKRYGYWNVVKGIERE